MPYSNFFFMTQRNHILRKLLAWSGTVRSLSTGALGSNKVQTSKSLYSTMLIVLVIVACLNYFLVIKWHPLYLLTGKKKKKCLHTPSLWNPQKSLLQNVTQLDGLLALLSPKTQVNIPLLLFFKHQGAKWKNLQSTG